MDDQEKTDTGTEIAGLAIETREDENAGLAEGEDDGEQFLGGLIQFAVGLEVKVDVDEMSTSEELSMLEYDVVTVDRQTYLEDHSGGYNGRRAQLHQGSPVTGQHHTQPVNWI